MESKYNPFEGRYPNRRKVIYEKDKYAESLINKCKSTNYAKNIDSLN